MPLNIGFNIDLTEDSLHAEGLRIFITGQSGSGKSYLAKFIIHNILTQRIPTVIIDPEGEYYFLREYYPTLIVGGANPLPLRDGACF